jgi:hypothetical protein
MAPVEELASPKLPQVETQTAYPRVKYVKRETKLTRPALMTPRVLVLLFSMMPSACWPNLLFNMLHVLAYVSSECAVRISSQSLDLIVEYDNAVIDVCLSEVSGTDKVVAFLAREPRRAWVTKRSFG